MALTGIQVTGSKGHVDIRLMPDKTCGVSITCGEVINAEDGLPFAIAVHQVPAIAKKIGRLSEFTGLVFQLTEYLAEMQKAL